MSSRFRILVQDSRGVALIEFSLVLPVLIMVVALMVDLGIGFHLRLRLVDGIAAGSYYAVENGSSIKSVNAAATAASIATIIDTVVGIHVDTTVLINGESGGANADNYYCVNSSSAILTSTGLSSVQCADATVSGKFMTIQGHVSYIPMFPMFEALGGNLSAGQTVTVRVQ